MHLNFIIVYIHQLFNEFEKEIFVHKCDQREYFFRPMLSELFVHSTR